MRGLMTIPQVVLFKVCFRQQNQKHFNCIRKPLWILFLIINDHLQNTLCKLDRQNNSPTNKEHAHKMREKSVSTMLFVVITVVVVGILYIAVEVKLEAR